MEQLKTYDFELAQLQYNAESNILFFRVKQDIVVDVNEISEMLRYAEEVMGAKKHYAVIDFGGSLLSTGEARDTYADSKYIQTYRIADAFLVKSLAVRIVANFFIQVTRPKVKTRLFTEEAAAVAWLNKLNVTVEETK